MKYGLISLFPAQLARLLGLVRYVEPVQMEGQSHAEWALLVWGRGFTRILRDQPLVSPSLLRTVDPAAPRPMRFLARRAAVGYAQSVGLLKHQRLWTVRGN